MRILHTSDWHLGRRFHEDDLTDSFARWIDFVAATVESEKIDAVVIAGDVYDRAFPPVSAVAMLDEALARLQELGVPVLISSGNHDSAVRLGFGSRLMAASGVHIGADVLRCEEPVRLRGTGKAGAGTGEGEGDVVLDVYLVPYLDTVALNTTRPGWVGERLAELVGERPADDLAVHRAVVERISAVIEQRAEAARAAGEPLPVAMGVFHSFAAGAEESTSEAEREIRQGGLGSIPTSLFGCFDYTALGHIHRRMALTERVRYSGSPIPFSFSEHNEKGGWIVEVSLAASREGAVGPEPAGAPEITVRPLTFTGYRRVARLEDTLENLLTLPRYAQHEQEYVQVSLTDAERPDEAMNRLRARFPHTMQLRFTGLRASYDEDAPKDLQGKSALQITEEFFEQIRQRSLDEAERTIITAALDEIASAETHAAETHAAEGSARA